MLVILFQKHFGIKTKNLLVELSTPGQDNINETIHQLTAPIPDLRDLASVHTMQLRSKVIIQFEVIARTFPDTI